MMATPEHETPEEAARRLTGHLEREGFRLEALHDYTTAEGLPSWWVIRRKHPQTGRKQTLPMHRGEGGAFVLKRPAFPDGAPLYRLHKLAQYPADFVWMAEGESCAECLEGLGLLATTWPNGAGAFEKADFRPLAGRWVICWPDNDGPGFAAMQGIRRILHKLGAWVFILDVERLGLPPKGDAVDWLAAFVASHGAAHLHEVAGGYEKAEAAAWQIPALIEHEGWRAAA